MPTLPFRLRVSSLFAVLCFLVMLHDTEAQRLPQSVKPQHYKLRLTPDLKTATFTGEETVDVVISEPVDGVTLNSAEIKFQSVTATLNGKALQAKVTEDAEKEQATFDFGTKLPAGKLTLAISYTGILNNELRGFYLSKTSKRNYAVTQFESTDARRAFPSFDEPAFKATFDVTLVVDKDDTAISNTNIISDKPQEDGTRHAITFAVTPKMSTYLVAFLVGDFKCLSGASDGVPNRVCATPDQVQYGAFALSAAEYALHYYNNYFGIKYPMPKLDMIAIPDFEAGAMENFGAITYRESDLLLDSKHASVGAQTRVGLVVTHEMAHQWFGDMVTMQWWDNLWLNEGFATWMENKPLESWKPEWFMSQQVARDNQGTLDLDAEHITRTIRAKAETPSEINEMFDGISYGKAGGVLLMVEHYLGEETFRQGVHNYLAAHLFNNATAEDFWSAQTAVSHKPVDKIMDSFVSEAGEPVLTFADPNGATVAVTQQRFFLNAGNKAGAPQQWTIPVCFKAGTQSKCEVLSPGLQQLATPATPLLFANADGKGYYRSAYPADIFQNIVAKVESDLTPEERISLLGDQWALTRNGKTSVDAYLNLVSAVKGDSNASVLDSVAGSLGTINARIADSKEERAQLAAWVRTQFLPAFKALGEVPITGTPAKRTLRARLLSLVAGLGKDSEAIAEAKAIALRGIADPTSVDPTIFETALAVAVPTGDEALFNTLQKTSTEASDPQLRSRALYALARFTDPSIERRALEYAVSGKVRNQDAASFIAAELAATDTRELAWQFIQQNWDKVAAQVTTSSGAYIVGAAGSFCSADKAEEVASFFNSHKLMAVERTLAQTRDQIHDCEVLRAAQGPALKEYLGKAAN